MESTLAVELWPRTAAAFGFGTAGAALSLLWWTPVISNARGLLPFALFIGTPGVSAAMAGWILGKPLLDAARCTPKSAALRGMAIGSLALLLFAPLFATFYVLTEPATEHWNVLGLTILLLLGGALAVWWLVALTGAAVGWLLYRVASSGRGKA